MLRRVTQGSVAAAFVLAGLSCKDLTGSPQLPSGVHDPSFYNTPSAAQGAYRTALYAFQTSLLPLVRDGGIITDELEDPNYGTSNLRNALDQRLLSDGSLAGEETYGDLQSIRGYAGQARAALLTYDTLPADSAKVRNFRGALALFTGYAQLWLADYFCSGVPLSTVDFQKDFTYAASSTTGQVYQAALQQLDTAVALTADSVGLQNTARIARGRLFLAIGQYDSAAAAVYAIPTAFRYELAIRAGSFYFSYNFLNDYATVADHEGVNGLPYVSSGDPRTAVTVAATTNSGNDLRYPLKYNDIGNRGFVPFVLADGIEARLIEAEVALHTHGVTSADTTWLHILNDLRATAPIPGTNQPDPTALPPLQDPGIANGGRARVALVFAERASWLFLTGHRQGDLRRLVRQYGWLQSQVYPTGAYSTNSLSSVYGGDVTIPIPATENANPSFHGCLDRNA